MPGFIQIYGRNRISAGLSGVVFAWILLFSSFAMAGEAPHLAHLTIANTRDHLLVYLSTKGAFTPELENAVMSGAPVTFSFPITLYRIRSLWMDKTIADITATHTIKYNTLKKEFAVTRSWETKSHTTSDFIRAKALMSEMEGLTIIALSELEKGGRYQIRAKAELSKVRLPLYLHYVLFFVSLWDFETDWYAVDFIY